MFSRVYKAGQIIKFTYVQSQDKFKEILVLNPLWSGKVHGIDIKRLNPAEREVLEAILDKSRDRAKRHRIPLVNDIRRRMDVLREIQNPQTFYVRFVKIFIRGKDVYRTYYPDRMLNVLEVKQLDVHGTTFNRKPLFKKI